MAMGIRRILVPLLVAEIALGLVFTANALVRRGCSLLPVALPEAGDVNPASPEQACAVLGRPLPNATVLPAGMRRADIGIVGPPLPGFPCCWMVQVSYAIAGNVAYMKVRKQDAIPPGQAPYINADARRSPGRHFGQPQYRFVSLGTGQTPDRLAGLPARWVTRRDADEFAATIR